MSLVPDPKMHKVWSLAKSGIRIVACILGAVFNNVIIIAVGIAAAELFGIIEEFA